MPQLYILMTQPVADKFDERMLDELADILTGGVEDVFTEVRGHDDVAFSVPQPLRWTRGESDVQIEVRYTVGQDEYNTGKPFEPRLTEQGMLCNLLRTLFWQFLHQNGMPKLSVSVWCKPHRDSVFRAFD